MIGARKSPAAKKPVAIQKMLAWMCQVRAKEYGMCSDKFIP